jgi:hypothetical protein
MRVPVIMLVLFVGPLLSAPLAWGDNLSVYVGYADSLRPNGFFPAPFCSTFGPTCQVGQVGQGLPLDGGVIRIENAGSNPISISNLTVTLNPTAAPITFALWSDVTIDPGGSAIFGQTQPTNPFLSNFDTSDYGILGSDAGISLNGIGGCTTLSALTTSEQAICTANFPIISFAENGHAVTITDTGSILNTGSYDFHYAPGDGNESINWNLAGAVGDRSGTETPEPGSLVLLGTGLLGLAGVARRKRGF